MNSTSTGVLSLQTAAVDSGAVVRAAAHGDAQAFEQLYEQYGRSVYNLVLRSTRDPATAEDLCQEVWVKAYRQLRGLREHGAFATWLYRIAARACIDYARRRPLGTLAELPDRASDEPGPEARAIRREQEGLAWEALAALPARQHVALFLREVEERSYSEIATIMETSESAVETLLFRARRGLAAAYERLQLAMPERCGRAREAMSALLDGEGTGVQRRAVGAHVDACEACRGQLQRMQRANLAYAAVPIAPVPALLAHRVIEAAGMSAITGGGGVLAKLLGLWGAHAKTALLSATLAGSVATGALLVSHDDIAPVPTSAVGTDTAVDVPADAAGATPVDAASPPAAGESPLPVAPAAAEDPASTVEELLFDLPIEVPPLAPTAPLPGLPAAPAELLPLEEIAPPTLPLEPLETLLPLPDAPLAPPDLLEPLPEVPLVPLPEEPPGESELPLPPPPVLP